MTRFLRAALAAALSLAWASSAFAADVKPLVNASGAVRPMHSGETVGVASGGTGAVSLTAHCVLVGLGTSAVHLVCPSNSGYVLTDNGPSSDPSFQAATGGGSPGGSSGQVQYNNSGAFGGFTVSGDGTLNTATGALAVTKTGGVSFGYFATGTDAANLTGTVSVNRFNSGTSASSSTFLRGDGTWQSVTASLPSIAAGHVIGNGTGSTATAADSTLTAVLDQAFSSTQGAVLYRSASAWLALAPGTAGQVLQTTGAGGDPFWGSVGGGGGGGGALTFIGARAYNSATQSIPNNSATSLTFNTNEFDTSGIHSTSTNPSRFTIPSGYGGKWRFTYRTSYAAQTTGVRILLLWKNGTTTVIGSSASAQAPSQTSGGVATVTVSAVVGDYFEAQVFQNSGGALNVGNTSNQDSSAMECQFLGS